MNKQDTALPYTKSSGNVFRDLGLPQPEDELLRAELTLRIYRLIKERGLTQTEAGKILGVAQPRVSELMRNRAASFSAERLFDFLRALGQDIEIRVKPASQGAQGTVSVRVAEEPEQEYGAKGSPRGSTSP